jgi:hypothetical protein
MRPTALSISSQSSVSSTSSSRDGKRFVSPRRLTILSTNSPPLSPGLPSILSSKDGLRSRTKSSKRSTQSYWRQIAYPLLAFCAVLYLILRGFLWFYGDSQQNFGFDLVDQSHLPEGPTALIIHDDKGDKKWTVWIPPELPFPLKSWDYAEICAQTDQLKQDLSGPASLFGKKPTYYTKHSKFVDVQEAIYTGLLPRPAEQLSGDVINHKSVCKRSLTFVMETDDAGMGNSLLALWLAYGLAQKESRAFFVDDSKW